jgi:dihydrofolate reductase
VRQLIVTEFVTLDGVMQGPGSPDEDRSGGFEHGGWAGAFFDEVQMRAVGEAIGRTGAYLLGRRTYEILAAHWPHQPKGDPFADTLNGLPKHVVSSTLEEPLAWQGATLVRGDVVSEVARLRAQAGGDISVLGSGQLVETLVEHGLVDRLVLMVCPLVLGGGKRLFRDGLPPARFQLVDATPTTTGVVMLSYEPATRGSAGEAHRTEEGP